MSMTIQKAIDTIITSIPGAPFPDTVDVIKLGDAQQNLTSIVVTFLATCDVIEQAIQLGANLIITHEPTFYNHHDATDWLSHHPAYAAKRGMDFHSQWAALSLTQPAASLALIAVKTRA